MKKLFISFVAMLACSTATFAEETDFGYFDHLSIGVNAGTPGIGVDVAAPIGNYVQIRAGYSFMPNIKYDTDLDVKMGSVSGLNFTLPSSVAVEGKTNLGNAKVLFDVYPFKTNAFHVTIGAYIGTSKVIKAYNKEDGSLKDIYEANEQLKGTGAQIGLQMGDYLLVPDKNGNMDADIRVNGFKPYVGLGYGRSVPNKSVGFMVELGAMFWGSPKVYCQNQQLSETNLDGDSGSTMKTISKLKVYPTLNFRLCFKAF